MSEKREGVQDSHLLNLLLVELARLQPQTQNATLWVSKLLVHLPCDCIQQILTSLILNQL